LGKDPGGACRGQGIGVVDSVGWLFPKARIPEVIEDQRQDSETDHPKWEAAPKSGGTGRNTLRQTEHKNGDQRYSDQSENFLKDGRGHYIFTS